MVQAGQDRRQTAGHGHADPLGGTVTPATLRQARAQIDLGRLRRSRLQRLRDQLARLGYGSCVLVDPVNLRYAIDSRNMQVFMLRNPARYVFVPVEGPVILFEFPGSEHLSAGLETIDEVRPAVTVSFVASGPRLADEARVWARGIAQLVREHGGGDTRLAVDHQHPAALLALAREGITVVDAQEAVELARSIKSSDELACIRICLAATELAVGEMEAALRPGVTENQLWAVLHERNIALGGEYVETRLLTSGPRTNPWFQECGDRTIQAGDLVAFDTDVNGPFGYYADLSRTFICGDDPTPEQRRLYQAAYEQLTTNLELLRAGMTFREYAEASWPIPSEFVANRYFVLAHGVGLSGEYPYIVHPQDLDVKGYDGVIEAGMTLCVESYIGREGGHEGVKLEEQVLVTDHGVERLSSYPFDETLRS